MAGRRNDGLVLRDHVLDRVGAALDLEDELPHEGLMVLGAQVLVALREVVAFLHVETFEGLDEVHRVLAALELRLLDAELEAVHRLEVRLDVAVGQRVVGRDRLQRRQRVLVEFLVVGRIERPLEHRDVAVDADEAVDLVAERRQARGHRHRAVAGDLVFLGEAEVVALVDDVDRVLAEEDDEQAVEIAADLRQERRHVGGSERNAGGADDAAARLLDRLGIGVPGRLAPGVVGKGDDAISCPSC